MLVKRILGSTAEKFAIVAADPPLNVAVVPVSAPTIDAVPATVINPLW